ncbi:uncharacterized protein L201_006984 [Kwoniella dendrophila CBS 6074]|uniref:CENP-V/GFA domain-containing protein n=1 Tax=Kwoniella dendrophila CBS 6074 TaxID=1295534 RepID=A0AAX4K5I0_9TREE
MVQTITASCHCKLFSHTIEISDEIVENKLPISETTCSCDACRFRTGQICILTLSAKITETFPSKEVLSKLKRYDQKCGFSIGKKKDDNDSQSNSSTNNNMKIEEDDSENKNDHDDSANKDGLNKYSSTTSCDGTIITQFFCGNCGTKIYLQVSDIFDEKVEIGMWLLGCLDKIQLNDNNGKYLVDLKGHHFLDDTKDGGIANIWNRFNGNELMRYHDSLELWEPKSIKTTIISNEGKVNELKEKEEEEMLNLHCKCNNFNVYVRRPKPELPLPENCYWYQHPYDDKGVPQRYMASWCACNSCRITTGSSIPAHSWVQIPFRDIFTSNSTSSSPELFIKGEMTPTTEIPGLTKYQSSPDNKDISRYFCECCGSSIMYFDQSRSFIGSFPIGLNDSSPLNGTLNQSWFSWWTGESGVSFPPPINAYEDGEKRWGKLIMKEFEDGLISWGKSIGQRQK